MAKCILALLFFVSPVNAEIYLDVYGFAYHPDNSRSCSEDKSVCINHPNENNYGLGLRRTIKHVDFGGGAFKDSFDDWSYYIGIEKQWKLFSYIHGGGQAFVMGRKTFRDYSPFLGILPVASIKFLHYSISMSYIPKVEIWKTREVFFFYASLPIR